MSENLEKQLLTQLKSHARLSNQDLADMTNVPVEQVAKTIQKLEKNGTIIQYTTILNESCLNEEKETIRALIEVSVRPEKKTGYDALAKRISHHPNVVGHYLISGNYDFLIIVEGSSLQEISQFVSGLASLENVRSTGTHFILKKYKENGVAFPTEKPESRLAIIP